MIITMPIMHVALACHAYYHAYYYEHDCAYSVYCNVNIAYY